MQYDRSTAYEPEESAPKGTPDKSSKVYVILFIIGLLILAIWGISSR